MRATGIGMITGLSILMSLAACSRSNNLILGRVEAQAGGHRVVVTDCYRTKVPGVEKIEDTLDGKPSFRFKPCKDADVIIRGDDLVVNGRLYGKIGAADLITVDHGRVEITKQTE
ncbi:MAG: hypothetical protein IPO77_11575 [Acidobacteria bacterium]|nr:hypothetical protein [Acidobacteriota bacterium]